MKLVSLVSIITLTTITTVSARALDPRALSGPENAAPPPLDNLLLKNRDYPQLPNNHQVQQRQGDSESPTINGGDDFINLLDRRDKLKLQQRRQASQSPPTSSLTSPEPTTTGGGHGVEANFNGFLDRRLVEVLGRQASPTSSTTTAPEPTTTEGGADANFINFLD